MKKTITLLAVAALVVSISGILAPAASAQKADVPKNPNAPAITQLTKEEKARIQEVERERARRGLPPSDALQALSPAERLLTKLTNAIERSKRLLELADRLIGKFESKGVDMTEPKTLRAAAVTAIENAEKAVAKFNTEINQTKTVITNLRKAGAEAIKTVKEAHAQVVKVISAIRASYNRLAEKAATTTP